MKKQRGWKCLWCNHKNPINSTKCSQNNTKVHKWVKQPKDYENEKMKQKLEEIT